MRESHAARPELGAERCPTGAVATAASARNGHARALLEVQRQIPHIHDLLRRSARQPGAIHQDRSTASPSCAGTAARAAPPPVEPPRPALPAPPPLPVVPAAPPIPAVPAVPPVPTLAFRARDRMRACARFPHSYLFSSPWRLPLTPVAAARRREMRPPTEMGAMVVRPAPGWVARREGVVEVSLAAREVGPRAPRALRVLAMTVEPRAGAERRERETRPAPAVAAGQPTPRRRHALVRRVCSAAAEPAFLRTAGTVATARRCAGAGRCA